MDGGAWWAAVHGVAKSRTRLSDFTFPFHFPALEKEMATHSSVLAWRIPGTGEPCGLPSVGSHRVGHDWSNLVAVVVYMTLYSICHSLSDLFHLAKYPPKSIHVAANGKISFLRLSTIPVCERVCVCICTSSLSVHLYSLTCWWTLRLLLYPGNYK